MPRTDGRLRVLFLCTGNSCRSQMAEGWARALKVVEIEAFSAGTHPHGVNRLAVRAMAEAGIDISAQPSKSVAALGDARFDYVVTVCNAAHEACPIFPGTARVVHVGFDDPPALASAAGANADDDAMLYYRRVRDDIKRYIETLPTALTSPAAPNTPTKNRSNP